MIFGQESAFESALEAVLQIRFGPSAVRSFAKSIADMDDPGLDAIVETLGLPQESLTPVRAKPNQEAKIVANFASVAIAGFETCLDFYHASAFSVREMVKAGGLSVEPMVRVDLHTMLFSAMVNGIRDLADKLPTEANNE
ncbi:MAG: hypothetical protein EOP50_14210 [Sphingobacteriales bacterium]|nr:MAG: hypothetical protein EOP50_14210 [Sphingobacteriales bacterium]